VLHLAVSPVAVSPFRDQLSGTSTRTHTCSTNIYIFRYDPVPRGGPREKNVRA
jgi:hypothetical protein